MILYFSLPNFYENFNINSTLKKIVEMNSEWLLYENIIFEYQNGSFPSHSWNGGFNNCGNNLNVRYMDFITVSNASSIVLNINCSNIKLTLDDLNDAMSKAILNCCHNGANTIEIADLKLKDYIEKEYPLYKFILSKENYWLNPTEYNSNYLNQIIDLDIFKMIMIPEHLSQDFSFLDKIKHKNKLCVAINPKCPNNCSYYGQCQINEHNLQLIYSQNNQIHNCPLRKDYQFKSKDTILDLKEKYAKIGITHFYFTEVFADKDFLLILNYYIHFFFKPEYHEQILTILLNNIGEKK